MKKINAFTLIELIISVTLSAIIMLSILIFVGDSIRNAKYNKQLIINQNENFSFEKELIINTDKITSSGIIFSGSINGYSGMFLATKNSSHLITFLGTRFFTGFCDSLTGVANEDGKIEKLVIKNLKIPTCNTGNLSYSIKGNQIFSGNTLIVGAPGEGDNLSKNPFFVELNNPSSIVGSGNYLFIADTGNSRILGYNTINKTISQILSSNDGINKPTDLFLTGSKLYVVNTGGGNILLYEDIGYGTGTELNINFKTNINLSSVNSINFYFPNNNNIFSSLTGSNFTFSCFTGTLNNIYSAGSGYLSYIFSGGVNFSTGINYGIQITNLPIPTSNTSNQYVKITLSGSNLFSDYFPYFSRNDNDLFTSTGNILQVVSSGLIMPNYIKNETTWNTDINDFTGILNSNTGEIVSSMPIKNFEYYLSGNLLTVRFFYYKYYDCINGKHILKERVLKKYIK